MTAQPARPPNEVSGATRHGARAGRAARRLFFALWPSEARQAELVDAARAALASVRGGRCTEPASLHLTLVFLGAVPESALASVRACALQVSESSRLARPGLEVTLDALEYWGRSRVVCATAGRPSAQSAALAQRLTEGLRGAGFSPDLKPFRAHVTLVRQLARRPGVPENVTLHLAPVAWTFADFALVESRPGPRGSLYSVLETWPLCRA